MENPAREEEQVKRERADLTRGLLRISGRKSGQKEAINITNTEIIQKLINAATGNKDDNLKEVAELRLTVLAVRKVTETVAVCGRGKNF